MVSAGKRWSLLIGLGVALVLSLVGSAGAVGIYSMSTQAFIGADVAVDAADNIVSSTHTDGVQVAVTTYDGSSLSPLSSFSIPVPATTGSIWSAALDVDLATGNIVLGTDAGADVSADLMVEVNSTGTELNRHDFPGGPPTQTVSGAYDSDGDLWRATTQWDFAPGEAQEYDLDTGAMIGSGYPMWSWHISAIDFDQASGIGVIGGDSQLYKFDPTDVAGTLTLIAGWSEFGDPGTFTGDVTGVAVRNNRVYASDYGNSRINIFNLATGAFIQEIPLAAPYAITVDSEGTFFVMLGESQEIVKFSYLGEAGDDDGDGVSDANDLCPGTPPGHTVNQDGCADDDADGVFDYMDYCLNTPGGATVDPCGCADTDGDGVYDSYDLCPGTPGGTQVNTEGCPDEDGDGIRDPCDDCPGTPPGAPVGPDGCLALRAYTHSVHPIAFASGGIVVEGSDNILTAHQSDGVNISVNRYDQVAFGAPLATYTTPAPTDDPSFNCYAVGIDVDPSSDNMTIAMNGGTVYTLTTLNADGALVSTHNISATAAITSDGANGAVDNNGNFWRVGFDWADYSRHADLLDLSNGSSLMSLVNNDYPPLELESMLAAVEVDQATGLVYIGDWARIWRFDPDDIAGTAVVIAGNPDNSTGAGPGEFGGSITGIAVKHDRIYTADYENKRVQIFDKPTGIFIQALTVPTGVFIVDLDVDSLGNIYANAPVGTSDIHKWSIDSDADGVADLDDLCPDTPPGTQVSPDGCPDTDGDGVSDADDICPGTPPGTRVDTDGCPDADGDNVPDPCDLCPGTAVGVPVDADGCPSNALLNSVLSDVTATAWGDYNNDGHVDMMGRGDLYTNNGDTTFTKTTPFPGLPNVSLGDWNNDGFLDVFSMYGGPILYTNDGDETWTDDTSLFAAGGGSANCSGSTLGDFNGDGYLDSYSTGWYTSGPTDADVIYMSNGGAGFTHTWTAPIHHGKGVTPCDFDEDGDLDIYVSNYWMDPSFLWRNDAFDGYTGLTDVHASYGVNDGPGHTQGSCWADFDNDGHFDLFVANFAHAGNPQLRFMENQGGPGYQFTDKGLCGLTQVEPLSCGIAGDYDNDGDVDLLVTVSFGYSWQHIMLYTNNADWTFTETTIAMGIDGQGPEDSGAWGDYDNDGYLDLIAASQLWHNPGGDNHWLKVKLLGGPHSDGLVNGSAIGAQVRIDVPGLGTLTRQVEANTGQLGSQNDSTMHFGLASYTSAVDLQIDWPNGYQETVYGITVDQAITIQLQPPVAVPPCWDYDTQCHGDADGDDDVDTVDWPVFRDAFGYAHPAAQYHPCADLDHDGDVDTADWPEFRDNFGYIATADCTPGGVWPPVP